MQSSTNLERDGLVCIFNHKVSENLYQAPKKERLFWCQVLSWEVSRLPAASAVFKLALLGWNLKKYFNQLCSYWHKIILVIKLVRNAVKAREGDGTEVKTSVTLCFSLSLTGDLAFPPSLFNCRGQLREDVPPRPSRHHACPRPAEGDLQPWPEGGAAWP